jgi:2-hydroxychromene-2-carboxylate isomerase
MGELVTLSDHARLAGAGARLAFYFDLACPFSYLAAERVERLLGEVQWIPVSPLATVRPGGALEPGAAAGSEAARAAAERQALDLRLPLVWPEPP